MSLPTSCSGEATESTERLPGSRPQAPCVTLGGSVAAPRSSFLIGAMENNVLTSQDLGEG